MCSTFYADPSDTCYHDLVKTWLRNESARQSNTKPIVLHPRGCEAAPIPPLASSVWSEVKLGLLVDLFETSVRFGHSGPVTEEVPLRSKFTLFVNLPQVVPEQNLYWDYYRRLEIQEALRIKIPNNAALSKNIVIRLTKSSEIYFNRS